MQRTTNEVYESLSGVNPKALTLHVWLDGEAVTGAVRQCVLTSAVGGGDSFTIGNALPAALSLELERQESVRQGSALRVAWSVDSVSEEPYPLFQGIVEKAVTTAKVTSISAFDPLYSAERRYAPSMSCIAPCTAADVLQELAEGLGVTLEESTRQGAAALSLPEGAGALRGMSFPAAAGTVAALMGGNAFISRAGALTVKVWEDTGWSGEAMAGAGTVTHEPYQVKGLTFLRKQVLRVVEEDGTVTETEREIALSAGTVEDVCCENQLANNALTDRAWAKLGTLPGFYAGQYTLAGGFLLEPGDIFTAITEDGAWTVFAGQVELSIQGGCTAAVQCWGGKQTVSRPSPLSQRLEVLEKRTDTVQEQAQRNQSIQSARSTLLETNLSVVEGKISAKVWQTDIDTAAETLNGEIARVKKTVSDNYSKLDLSIDGIKSEVGSVKRTVEELELGGRNLILDSKTLGSYSFVAR